MSWIAPDDLLGSGGSQIDLFEPLHLSYSQDKLFEQGSSKVLALKTDGPDDKPIGNMGQSMMVEQSGQVTNQHPKQTTKHSKMVSEHKQEQKGDSGGPKDSNSTSLPTIPEPITGVTAKLASGACHQTKTGGNHIPSPLKTSHDPKQSATDQLRHFSRQNASNPDKEASSTMKEKATPSAVDVTGASDVLRPAPSAEEIAKFESMLRKSSCRKTTIMFSMEWLGVKVKSASILKGLDDFARLADEQTEGSAANLHNCKMMVSGCKKVLHSLYSQAHVKMAVETDPAKKQLIQLASDERIGLIRFHVRISRFRQAFNSLTGLAVRLCQKKGKALYSEVMTVSRINVLTLEQEVIYKIGSETGETHATARVVPNKLEDEESDGSQSPRTGGPQTKVYKKDGHKDGKLVQSFEVPVEEQRNGFYNATSTTSKHGDKKTLLWEAQYPHAPGLDIVIYFLVIKEISPSLFWSMKREISSKQLNDIDRYGQMIKICLLPEDEELKANRVFDFKTGKHYEEELIQMQIPQENQISDHSKKESMIKVKTQLQTQQEVDSDEDTPQGAHPSPIKLSPDPVDELVFQRRDMILQNPFCLSQLQPRQVLTLLEQVIDRNNTLRYLNLGETYRRTDFYRQQLSVRAVINSCAKITLFHLKKIHGIEYKVLRLKLGEEHFSSRIHFDGKTVLGRPPESLVLEYPDYDGLIFSESITLLHLVFQEQLDHLNVKEYVGRLKTSFDKPFVLTSPVPLPLSSAQKESVKPRAPPPPSSAVPQFSTNNNSVLAELAEPQPSVKQKVGASPSSAGKTQQLKHLQAGSDVLHRLAMVASVSRGNTSADFNSTNNFSGQKPGRDATDEGNTQSGATGSLHQPLPSVKHGAFATPLARASSQMKNKSIPKAASSGTSVSSELEDLVTDYLGKRQPPRLTVVSSRKAHSPGESGQTVVQHVTQSSSSRAEETTNLKKVNNKMKGVGGLAEKESVSHSVPQKPKRKISISKDDLRVVREISILGNDKQGRRELSQEQKMENDNLESDLVLKKPSIIRPAIDPRAGPGSATPIKRERDVLTNKTGLKVASTFQELAKERKRKNSDLKRDHSEARASKLESEPTVTPQSKARKPPATVSARTDGTKPQLSDTSDAENQATEVRMRTKRKRRPKNPEIAIQGYQDDIPPADFDTPEESESNGPSLTKTKPKTRILNKKRSSPVSKKTPHKPELKETFKMQVKPKPTRKVPADDLNSESTSNKSSPPTRPQTSDATGSGSSSEEESDSSVLPAEPPMKKMPKRTVKDSSLEQTSASDMVIMIADEDMTQSKISRSNYTEEVPSRPPAKQVGSPNQSESGLPFVARLADLQKRIVKHKDPVALESRSRDADHKQRAHLQDRSDCLEASRSNFIDEKSNAVRGPISDNKQRQRTKQGAPTMPASVLNKRSDYWDDEDYSEHNNRPAKRQEYDQDRKNYQTKNEPTAAGRFQGSYSSKPYAQRHDQLGKLSVIQETRHQDRNQALYSSSSKQSTIRSQRDVFPKQNFASSGYRNGYVDYRASNKDIHPEEVEVISSESMDPASDSSRGEKRKSVTQVRPKQSVRSPPNLKDLPKHYRTSGNLSTSRSPGIHRR